MRVRQATQAYAQTYVAEGANAIEDASQYQKGFLARAQEGHVTYTIPVASRLSFTKS
jgi:hypothetical protein